MKSWSARKWAFALFLASPEVLYEYLFSWISWTYMLLGWLHKVYTDMAERKTSAYVCPDSFWTCSYWFWTCSDWFWGIIIAALHVRKKRRNKSLWYFTRFKLELQQQWRRWICEIEHSSPPSSLYFMRFISAKNSFLSWLKKVCPLQQQFYSPAPLSNTLISIFLKKIYMGQNLF